MGSGQTSLQYSKLAMEGRKATGETNIDVGTPHGFPLENDLLSWCFFLLP